jgi:hypothetical protein
MPILILQHSKRADEGEFAHDVERKPIEPVRDIDRQALRQRVTQCPAAVTRGKLSVIAPTVVWLEYS